MSDMIFDNLFKKEIKQAIIVRTDINMDKGKICAQVGHAAVSGYLNIKLIDSSIARKWIEQGQKKIILKINNEKEFFCLFEKIKKEIPCTMIADAGKTQIESGTKTCFSIGPFYSEDIDKFVLNLKLL